MVDMDDPDEVIAAAGRFNTAMTTMTGAVGSTVTDDLILHSRADSPLDRALTTKLEWIHTSFDTAVREANSQAGTTSDATAFAATTLGNADIDGATTVRRVAT